MSDVSLVGVDFCSIVLDHLSELCDVVGNDVIEPFVFFFEPCILLKDVVIGHEPKGVFSAGGEVPENRPGGNHADSRAFSAYSPRILRAFSARAENARRIRGECA